MKARGAEKNFHEIIARNVEGGGGFRPPPALLGLKVCTSLHISVFILFFKEDIISLSNYSVILIYSCVEYMKSLFAKTNKSIFVILIYFIFAIEAPEICRK